MRIGIVVADFNAEMTHAMAEIAEQYAQDKGAQVVRIINVPGAFDMPVAIKKLLKEGCDGVVTLGAIIKGGTKHDEVIANALAVKVADLSCEFDKPVSLGVIGPGADYDAAKSRYEEYAKRAVDAVLDLGKALRE